MLLKISVIFTEWEAIYTKWFGPYAIDEVLEKAVSSIAIKTVTNEKNVSWKSIEELFKIIDLTYMKERKSKILACNNWVNDVVIDNSLQLLDQKSFQSCFLCFAY